MIRSLAMVSKLGVPDGRCSVRPILTRATTALPSNVHN
jgi:hypothetical protein